MFTMKLFYGRVEDNVDPDEKGKLQIRLIPEMKDVEKDDLPWLRPFSNSAMTGDTMDFTPIETGTNIWCMFVDDDFRYGWYLTGVFVDSLFDHGVIESDLGNIEEIGGQDYPNVKFTRYEDGTILFHNVKTGETGIYHKSGSYTIFSDSGDIISYSKGDIHLYNDQTSLKMEGANIIQDANGEIQLNGSGDSLVKLSYLEQILDGINSLMDAQIHVDPLTGTTGPPSGLMLAVGPTTMGASPQRINLGTKTIVTDPITG